MATEYQVLDPFGPRKAVAPQIQARAVAVAAMAAAGTPRDTGALAGGWRVVPGRHHAVFLVENDVPHGMYVEHGTRSRPAAAMLGRAIAANR